LMTTCGRPAGPRVPGACGGKVYTRVARDSVGGRHICARRAASRWLPVAGTLCSISDENLAPMRVPRTGIICRGHLDDAAIWSPAMSLQELMVSVAALLSCMVRLERGGGDEDARHLSRWQQIVAKLWTRRFARSRCAAGVTCGLCQQRAEAFAMGLHRRLGKHSTLQMLSGVEGVPEMIDSLAHCRAGCVAKNFLREWAAA